MVTDYEYENLFAEHITADFIIVDSGASVTANAGHEPTISDEEFIITNDELQSETIKLSESLCSDQNLTFGKMEASKLTFTLKNKADYPTNLSNTEIDVYLYFNGDSDTLFKVGRYTIDSDKYSDDRYTRSITAYDMIYYLKSLDITEWYNAYYENGQSHMLGLVILNLFNWISDPNDEYPNSPKIDIQLESGYNLCNGTFSLGRTIESDSITFEFFMQRILEFNGAFGHINRQGNFEFVVMQWYDAQPVRIVTNDYRIPPTPFDSVSTWGIGGIDVYDENNIRKFTVRNTNKKVPSIYVIVDSFVLSDRDVGDSDVEAALKRLHQVINHYNYKSCKTACTGDLCVEVGDRINVRLIQDETNPLNWFRSYVLERTFTGIQGMTDVYQAKGDQKQPVYTVNNDNWHSGDNSGSTSGSGTGGVAVVDDEINKKFVEIIRNIGYRLLNEPDVHLEYNKSAGQVEINWEDPTDITTYNPLPVEWAGTVVVRKEGKTPLHRYGGKFGGTLLVDSTTRDQYKLSSYIDNTIEPNKKYFYGIFPYSIGLDDADHPIRHYRFTKVISVDTTVILVAPTIYPIQEGQIVGTTVTVNYSIPTLEEGSYAVQKLVVKKGSIPTSKTDGDKIIDLTPDTSLLINSVTVVNLDEDSQYYFVIFIEDEIGSGASSEPVECMMGEYDNILTPTQRNIGTWAKTFNFTASVTYLNNINSIDLYTSTGWEGFETGVLVQKNQNYTLKFRYRTTTGYEIAPSHTGIVYERVYVFADYITSTDLSFNRGAENLPYLAKSDGLYKNASTNYQEYTITFNSGNNNLVYLFFDYGYLEDSIDCKFDIDNLRLIGNEAPTPAIRNVKYIKFDIVKNRGNQSVTQLSEIKIKTANGVYLDISNATITSNKAGTSQDEDVTKLIDDNLDTKFCVDDYTPSSISPLTIVIELAATVDISNYCKWEYYTANDHTERDPVSLNVYASADGTNYYLSETVSDASITTERKELGYEGLMLPTE